MSTTCFLLQQASKLKNETSNIKTDAQTQRETLDRLGTSIDQLDGTTSDFENQAQSDEEKSAEILRKAIHSDTSAKSLQSRLNESESQLNDALTQLS